MVTLKDIIRVNQEIGETGEVVNQSSLEFAFSIIKQRKSWLFELSYLVRSLLVDHVFRDGNKRTGLALILAYFDYRGVECDKERISLIVYTIAKKNIKDINKIMRMINRGIIYR